MLCVGATVLQAKFTSSSQTILQYGTKFGLRKNCLNKESNFVHGISTHSSNSIWKVFKQRWSELEAHLGDCPSACNSWQWCFAKENRTGNFGRSESFVGGEKNEGEELWFPVLYPLSVAMYSNHLAKWLKEGKRTPATVPSKNSHRQPLPFYRPKKFG